MMKKIILAILLIVSLPVFAQHFVLDLDADNNGLFGNNPRKTPDWFVKVSQVVIDEYDETGMTVQLLNERGNTIREIVLDDYACVEEDGKFIFLKYGVFKNDPHSYLRIMNYNSSNLVLTLGVPHGRIFGSEETAWKYLIKR